MTRIFAMSRYDQGDMGYTGNEGENRPCFFGWMWGIGVGLLVNAFTKAGCI